MVLLTDNAVSLQQQLSRVVPLSDLPNNTRDYGNVEVFTFYEHVIIFFNLKFKMMSN